RALPRSASRFLRRALRRSSRGQGYGIAEITVKPVAFSASPNDFFAAIARDAPRGTYPKYLDGRQTSWALLRRRGALPQGGARPRGPPRAFRDGAVPAHVERPRHVGRREDGAAPGRRLPA